MLRGVVETFLRDLTEREFDGPLLAILAAQGCTDIHFIHGAFEFGKDVIAKRQDPVTGDFQQLSIQSKAGDLSLHDWRLIRPQLEECEYNTRSHPDFDANLPRVAVLVTTGRLKGGAAIDAQEYRERCQARGLADFEPWEREDLLHWLCQDPALGLAGRDVDDALLDLISTIRSGRITEPALETYSRAWLDDRPLGGTSIEVALICHTLRARNRLDLAALFALHFLRAAVASMATPRSQLGRPAETTAGTAIRLFNGYATDLLTATEPMLRDPRDFARPTMTALGALATYPAVCCRVLEVVALLAISTDHPETATRARSAVKQMVTTHPGATRPPNDSFAASILPAVIALGPTEKQTAVSYVRSVSNWLLDRYDPESAGLGLASLHEDERATVARLLGGALTTTGMDRRTTSYLATVLLDALILLEAEELYEALLSNLAVMKISPTITLADESTARWRRGGTGVWPHPRVDYQSWNADRPQHVTRTAPTSDVEAVLLGVVCRSRHYLSAARDLLQLQRT